MIDSHTHVWDAERFPMAWLGKPGNEYLRSRYDHDDLDAALAPSATAAVVVQAGTTLAGTLHALAEARALSIPTKVVASFDVAAEGGELLLEQLLTELSEVDGADAVRGVRINSRGRGAGWFETDHAMRLWEILDAHSLSPHLLIDQRQLPGIAVALRSYGDVTAVIDHLGMPCLTDTDDRAAWTRDIEALADAPNVRMKLSGLISPAPLVEREVLTETVRHTVRTLGQRRLMYGGDWPTCLRFHSYGSQLEVMAVTLEDVAADLALGADDVESIWSGTAAEFYDLPDASMERAIR